ncbi:hypothetical protein AKI39_14330 [Bordetella sp. H567]|uniref:hypothetical protein n=1 Tax=Bordetella sp. H567 TaxID=1697043 RepID=UPI00081C5881|nr:hypothetical protein [Bordetella sp. H567]AOB31610.1 hypothetical protein AKI39_14330 [Bordetella sp. H567]
MRIGNACTGVYPRDIDNADPVLQDRGKRSAAPAAALTSAPDAHILRESLEHLWATLTGRDRPPA